ncbi:MAG: NADH-quinone oxidoreductase subunit NuoG [Nitrospirae bacterium]|nr:NADH-quinone oxidoreductase subunit NuoG [Nitrospirota bacterium]
MITITINGKEIKLEKPVTVLEAARANGIKIPALCAHEQLEKYGGCRLCLVEVEKMPRLQTSCTLTVADGMVIKTESENITKARRGVLEFLLINHPLDCPVCDKAGECELQDLVSKYGASAGRFKEEKRKTPESHEDRILARNMERCILCTRCVRMCKDVQGASALTIVERGGKSRMEPFSRESFNCEYCGNCHTVCPVGAILARPNIHNYRPWQIDREVETVCPYCGVGCSFILQVRDESIKRTIPKLGLGLNNGLLCSRGRWGYDFANNPERLKYPLIRKNGKLEQSSWDEALGLIVNKLQTIKNTQGGKAIAGIASPRCTNEDNYVFQKFLRTACQTNNIDSVSRLGFASAQRYFEDILGQGITANMIAGLKNSDVIIVLGGDPTAVNPILGLSVRAAARNGAKIVVIGNAKGLERFKTLKVTPPVFKEADVLEAVLSEIAKVKGPRGEKPAIDKRINELAGKYRTPEISGFNELKELLLSGKSVSIVLGTDIVQRTNGHKALFAVAGITYLLEARLYLLSERANEQGLIDMGCLPDALPGGRPLNINDFRKRFETSWGSSIPSDNGLTLMEIVDASRDKKIKALYVMGENPAFNIPNNPYVKEALSALEFLVVQDIFLTETAEIAHVVLPALSWSEKDGTYTNLERRIQRLRKAVNAPSGMEDWKIISEVSNRMGCKMQYRGTEEIIDEIADISPLYKGLTYDEITKGNCLWPYKGEPLRGVISEIPAAPEKSDDYKGDFYLVPEKLLFHSGTLSRRSSSLNRICPEPSLKIGEGHAQRLGLKDGDNVKIHASDGNLSIKISTDRYIKDNLVFISNNFEGRGVFSLLRYSLDPVTKAPGLEGCEIKIEKA